MCFNMEIVLQLGRFRKRTNGPLLIRVRHANDGFFRKSFEKNVIRPAENDELFDVSEHEMFLFMFLYGGHPDDPCGIFALRDGRKIILRMRQLDMVIDDPR